MPLLEKKIDFDFDFFIFFTWDCRGKQKGIQILLISCWKWAFILFFLPSFLNKFNGPPLTLIFLCCSFLTSSTLWFGVLRLLEEVDFYCWRKLFSVERGLLTFKFKLSFFLLLLKYFIPLVHLQYTLFLE